MSRPPYDDADLQKALRYLKEKGRRLVDPPGKDAAPSDPYFAPSLLATRRLMEFAFGNKRADGTEFRVYPAFVDRSPPNAFAIDLGTVHLCGVDAGLVTTSFELCCFSLSQREFLTEIGDASIEESPALPEGAALGFWIMDSIAASYPARVAGLGEALIPLDADRRLAAHLLSQLMLRFAWFHEMFHGLNGHSGYVASIRKGAELKEFPEPDENDDLSLAGRTELPVIPVHSLHGMEFDADRSALWLMIRLQEADEEPFATLAEFPQALRLKLVGVAALLTVFLFDQAAKRTPPKATSTHPAARLRLYNLLGMITSNRAGESSEGARATIDALIEIGRLRNRISSFPDLPRLKQELSSAVLQASLDQADTDLAWLREQWRLLSYRRPA